MVSCAQCTEPAVLELRYEKRSLCPAHFNKLFSDRVRRADREFRLMRRGDRVAAALSGGKDSAALLFSLHQLAPKAGFELLPFLIDEGIAGYRTEAVKEARALCEQLGYELREFSYREIIGTSMDEAMKLREQRGLSQKGVYTSCSFCGVWRRKGMEHAAREMRATSLATGHNLDDVVQTYLMNLLRGEPGRGVMLGNESHGDARVNSNGVSERHRVKERGSQVRRIKPLIYCPERECALYSELNGLPYHLGECPYAGEGFRQPVKRFLNDMEGRWPGVKFALLRSYLELERAPNPAQAVQLRACSSCGAPSTGGVCRSCEYARALAPE